MEKLKFAALRRLLRELRTELRTNHLWQRIVKYTVATSLTVIISIIPAAVAVFGPATFLAPMTTVFGHCGQRLGLMVESLLLILSGTVLGVGWSVLGLYLSSLVYGTNAAAAYTIRALFLAAACVLHGFLRSASPRLFVFVLFLLIVSVITLLGTATAVTPATATGMMYPIFSAASVLLVVNLAVFPELSSSFVGTTTIETLYQTSRALRDASDWFVDLSGTSGKDEGESEADIKEMRLKKLASLTESKAKLRSKLVSCKAVQGECMFEITFSVLPPSSLRPISGPVMSKMVQSAVGVIGACESKYALVGARELDKPELDDVISARTDFQRMGGLATPPPESSGGAVSEDERRRSEIAEKVKLFKPRHEIESGDTELLESILAQVRRPVQDLRHHIDKAVDLVIVGLAYCFDVERLPSGAITPTGIPLEEVDVLVDLFASAISTFDKHSTEALGSVASKDQSENSRVDILPRTETFLISSFLLNLKSAAVDVMQMLKHTRSLMERRHLRRSRRRLWLPRKINWRKWLISGGETDGMVLPQNARKEARLGQATLEGMMDHKEDDMAMEDTLLAAPKDPEAMPLPLVPILPMDVPEMAAKTSPTRLARQQRRRRKRTRQSGILQLRGAVADAIEQSFHSEDLSYALKLAVAVFLVSWPAFVASWNGWYAASRGVWAPLQLVLVFEVAIGTSFFVFIVRAAGVLFGCLCGYLSFVVGQGNLVVLVVILLFGIVPSAFVQIGTRYVKAGMISVVSMTVVALATVNRSGAAEENFTKRLAAFIIGGTVGLLVEVVLYPVKARDRLVESISSCLDQVTNMELAVAAGIDTPDRVDLRDRRLNARFARARAKAQTALGAAETFLPFCLTEPRLKGSFRTLEPIYKEMLFVLHQIVDRMDGVVRLRRAYGSSVLEDLNPRVFAHRRNVAASVTLTLFAVNEALTTRLPLPQFLPSSRLAQLRLVHRVREVLLQSESPSPDADHASSRARDTWRHNSSASLALGARSTPEAGGGPAAAMRSAAPSAVALGQATIQSITAQRFLSWNAAAAGQMEIIEYLEELVDLAKLLVGVNAFRSGMLERPSYRQYVRKIRTTGVSAEGKQPPDPGGDGDQEEEEARDVAGEDLEMRRSRKSKAMRTGLEAGKGTVGSLQDRVTDKEMPIVSSSRDKESHDLLPPSLQRVGTRMRKGRNVGIGGLDMSEGKGKEVATGSQLL